MSSLAADAVLLPKYLQLGLGEGRSESREQGRDAPRAVPAVRLGSSQSDFTEEADSAEVVKGVAAGPEHDQAAVTRALLRLEGSLRGLEECERSPTTCSGGWVVAGQSFVFVPCY